MKTELCVKGEITKDRRLLVDLPPELPSGRVVLTLKFVGEDDLEVRDKDLQGLGLTAEEIAASPEIGAWGGNPEVSDGAEYVENLRRARPRYSW
jgi:hypothetical protein